MLLYYSDIFRQNRVIDLYKKASYESSLDTGYFSRKLVSIVSFKRHKSSLPIISGLHL